MVEKGVDISWQDFSVVRPLSKSEKRSRIRNSESLSPIPVVNKISGCIHRGSFTTILGASGSGKTTFLNFLSNRRHYLSGLEYTGSVFINGHHRESLDFNSVAGYVMQDEVLLEHLKVRETLEFSASFKMSRRQVKGRVDEIIEQLGLKSCEESFIGGFLKKGISGGEKKRVSIGVELLTDPSILFLDEPTTGLDSFNAESLIELMRKLSGSGVTVVATIHQPNSFIYSLFDKVLLFGGNEIVYHGEAVTAMDYFQKLGFFYPEFSNPSEFLLELVTEIDDDYKENIEKIKAAVEKKELIIVKSQLPELFQRESAGFFKELQLLIKRSSLNGTRNLMSIIYKVSANVMFLLIVMAAYFDACSGDDFTSLRDRAGIIFILHIYMAFIGANSTTSLSTDKAIFIREQASKMYSPGAFYLSKLIFDIPFDQIITFCISFLLYLAVGLSLDHVPQIFFFVFIILLLDFTSRGYGNFLLIFLPNIEAASIATPFTIMIQLLFAGLFVNYDSIPNYLIWLEYSSMFKYSWSACMINELEHYDNDYWEECQNGLDEKIELCDPLDFYNIQISKWQNVLALSCIAIITHFLAFLYLCKISKKYRVN
jgi:ABC-type multidrug transport system ATPase subunit